MKPEQQGLGLVFMLLGLATAWVRLVTSSSTRSRTLEFLTLVVVVGVVLLSAAIFLRTALF